jgi:hypothetical protein
VLELAYRADSNSAARTGLWVRVPPAVPTEVGSDSVCRAQPPDGLHCARLTGFGQAYAYLLGLYLGDGSLSYGRGNVWRLRITLDSRYPGIIERAKSAVEAVRGRPTGSTIRSGCVDVSSYWKHWVCLFPQHGVGPKHRREMRLTTWQSRIVEADTAAFLAGLIHSDGCRTMNRVKGHEYPRYFFSNLSLDIRELFVAACTRLGVDSRPAGRRNVAVSKRASVAILDRLVGPKR